MSAQQTPQRYSPENPPPLRRDGESVEDYRVRCGWDAPKASAQHTPGPWAVYPETDGTEICAVDIAPGLPIRQIVSHIARGENWIANARLIAAAPELLLAVRALMNLFEQHEDRAHIKSPVGDYARAAIAKATGSTHV